VSLALGCEECDRTFVTVLGLSFHRAAVHPAPVDDWVRTYRAERPERPPDDPLACPWGCGHLASDVPERNRHAREECEYRKPERWVAPPATTLPALGKLVTCEECGGRFAPRALRRHLASAHPQPKAPKAPKARKPVRAGGPQQCHLCPKVCDGPRGLGVHLRAAHGSGRDVVVCSLCSKECSGRMGLGVHLTRAHRQPRGGSRAGAGE
jgi:hypothetical protein